MSVTRPEEITAAAVASFEGCPDPRARELMQALTRHLHALVAEVGLTASRPSTYVPSLGWCLRSGGRNGRFGGHCRTLAQASFASAGCRLLEL